MKGRKVVWDCLEEEVRKRSTPIGVEYHGGKADKLLRSEDLIEKVDGWVQKLTELYDNSGFVKGIVESKIDSWIEKLKYDDIVLVVSLTKQKFNSFENGKVLTIKDRVHVVVM